jgi:hypothetical protein
MFLLGWSYTGNISKSRSEHTASVLTNGKVLIAGGMGFSGTSCKQNLLSCI